MLIEVVSCVIGICYPYGRDVSCNGYIKYFFGAIRCLGCIYKFLN